MRVLKFRQAIYSKDKFDHWHYWGFLPDLSFVGPDSINGLAHALDNSQQFTGLFDKHGTEIYKGDIVRLLIDRAHYTGEKDKYRQEIVTKGCSCGLNTNGMISIQKEGQKEYEPQLEVIGTIHTHPELLE